MGAFVIIAVVVAALLVLAVLVLVFDVGQGAVGGGRKTLARARRVLVISTDAETESRGRSWAEQQRHERPELECVQLFEPEGEAFMGKVHEAMEQHQLSAAGSSGTVGPNLDDLHASKARVLAAIRNGGTGSGAMPKDIVVGKEAETLADFVADSAGGK